MEILFNDNTKEALLKKLNEENKSAVRFVITGISWGGPKIDIVLDEQKKHDLVYTFQDIKFVIISSYSNLTGKFTINYRRNLSDDSFIVIRG